MGVVELVEGAAAGVDHDRVAIATGARAAFDRGVSAEGVRHLVTFGAVGLGVSGITTRVIQMGAKLNF